MLSELGEALCNYMAQTPTCPLLSEAPSIPPDLFIALNESYLSSLSEQFSCLSHEGPYTKALGVGKVLLDLYRLIYPPNYPQIGMHCLELAKTAWNNVAGNDTVDPQARQEIGQLVESADDILRIMGQEGDEDGPLQELETLKTLLTNV